MGALYPLVVSVLLTSLELIPVGQTIEHLESFFRAACEAPLVLIEPNVQDIFPICVHFQ